MHSYTITVEKHSPPDQAAIGEQTLRFEAQSHDDILAVLDKMRRAEVLDEASLPQLAVGLKLFAGILLQHKDQPPFAELGPHFGAFMKGLKALGKERAPRSQAS